MHDNLKHWKYYRTKTEPTSRLHLLKVCERPDCNTNRVLTWDLISVKNNFSLFGVWSKSYNCLRKIPQNELIACVISLWSFQQKWNFIFDGGMLCKHYPKMKSCETKYPHIRLKRKYTIRIKQCILQPLRTTSPSFK